MILLRIEEKKSVKKKPVGGAGIHIEPEWIAEYPTLIIEYSTLMSVAGSTRYARQVAPSLG